MFQPYTRQQLETIAKTRLDGLNVFESRAIEYAARKVRQLFGDDDNIINTDINSMFDAVQWYKPDVCMASLACLT